MYFSPSFAYSIKLPRKRKSTGLNASHLDMTPEPPTLKPRAVPDVLPSTPSCRLPVAFNGLTKHTYHLWGKDNALVGGCCF